MKWANIYIFYCLHTLHISSPHLPHLFIFLIVSIVSFGEQCSKFHVAKFSKPIYFMVNASSVLLFISS